MMIQSQHKAQDAYTDLNALQNIRKLGKEDKNAALMETAKQFESMFLNMVLRSMRQANAVFEDDSLLHSSQMDFYQGMLDDQMALSLSSGQGIGLAPVIFEQLQRAYGDKNERPELDQGKLFDRRISVPISLSRQALNSTADEVERLRKQAPSQDPLISIKTQSIAQGVGDKGQQFATAEDFVAALYPVAEQIGKELDVEPKAIVAQAALETGWGKFMLGDQQGNNSFNFFGIKADSRWSGERVRVQTHEFREGRMVKEYAEFRSYGSLEEGMRDYAEFLQSSSRYEQALGKGLDANQYGYALQQAGYATDPNYGAKIQRIAAGELLNPAAIQQ